MNYQKITPAAFLSFAGTDQAVWNAIVGQRLTHSKFGIGNIIAIEPGDPIYVLVKFDKPIESFVKGITDDPVALNSTMLEKYTTELTLPPDLSETIFAHERLRLETEERRQSEAERQRQEERRRQESQIVSRHREHMVRVGVPYQGTREKTTKSVRKTHCWNCKMPINNVIFRECVVCGWIICDCGACGCGYQSQ